MLKRIHASHVGGDACYRQARDTYWSNMHSKIKGYVSQCLSFNEYAHEQQRETVMSHALPTRPWQIISMDLFTQAGKDFLIMVDHYSDFWEIELLLDLSAETTVLRCKAQLARHGQPDRVITDCGAQFDCETFRRVTKHWDFDHIKSSPRYPNSNGKAESAVKIVKSLCKKAARVGTDPWLAILQWKNTPIEGMLSSPAQRLMSCRLRTPLPVADTLLEPSVVAGVPDRLQVNHQILSPSYQVGVEGTQCSLNRVDLQPAESNTAKTKQQGAQCDSPPGGRPLGTPDNAIDTNNDTATVFQGVRPPCGVTSINLRLVHHHL